MYLVSAQCSWKDLVSMIHTNKDLREAVFFLIRTRIKMFISPFVPVDKIGKFFDLMDDSNAAIFGGVVRCIMSTTSDIYRVVTPDHLDLVVPSIIGSISRFRRWIRFLATIGYKELLSCDADEDLPSCVRWSVLSNVRLLSVSHPFQPFNSLDFLSILKDSNMTLTLIESNGPNILPVILQAPHTSSLNILTSTRFYCFYPTLFASREGIRMKHWPIRFYSPFSHFNFGLRIYRTTSIWIDAPCGDACPSLWRRTKDLPGVGLVRWGTLNGNLDLGNKTPSKSDGFEKICFLWKIDGRCINPLCPNRGREVDLFGNRGYY